MGTAVERLASQQAHPPHRVRVMYVRASRCTRLQRFGRQAGVRPPELNLRLSDSGFAARSPSPTAEWMVPGPERHTTLGCDQYEPVVDAEVPNRPGHDRQQPRKDERDRQPMPVSREQPDRRDGQEEKHRGPHERGGAGQDSR